MTDHSTPDGPRQPLEYGADDTPPQHRRGGGWPVLLLVWGAGLISWAFWVALIIYGLTRIMG
jgi:hypothetical protein